MINSRDMNEKAISDLFLESVKFRFAALKALGDKAMEQVCDEDLTWSPDGDSNSIAIIANHLHGNMLSRWTGFLNSDGEKATRNRDAEFEPTSGIDRRTLLDHWEDGWLCLFQALDSLQSGDLSRQVTIRGQSLSVIDAIHRQLSHYGYHVGQIVYLARIRTGQEWLPLSILKGQTKRYRPTSRD